MTFGSDIATSAYILSINKNVTRIVTVFHKIWTALIFLFLGIPEKCKILIFFFPFCSIWTPKFQHRTNFSDLSSQKNLSCLQDCRCWGVLDLQHRDSSADYASSEEVSRLLPNPPD